MSLQQRIDDWRVRQHFKRVELILRDRDVSHLPLHLQQSRDHYLDVLHDYAIRGVFPRNHERAGISPCFIDRDGRECAVAHLVMRSGHEELARKIALIDNYATVPQMQFPELDAWGTQAGLTREELTLIQPGYWYTFSDLLPFLLTVWIAAVITIKINVQNVFSKRRGFVMPIFGVVVTAALIYMALLCFREARTAYDLATQPYDGYQGRFPGNPMPDVAPLIISVIVSAGLALLSSVLSFHRVRTFFHINQQ